MIIKIKNENLFNIRRDIGVYLIRCIPENKIYIGSTNQSFRARFSNHCKFLKSGNLGNKKLQDDFNKYGENNFEFEILGIYPENLTVHYEQFFINTLNPYYNVTKACNKSLTNKDKKFSEEHKEKIRQKSKLYKHSPKSLKLLTDLNKSNSSLYCITNINTNETFNKTYFECFNFFKSIAFMKRVGKIYKNEWKIDKLKTQAKTISLFVNNNWILFESFEKCDKFLNKWRGYTSTQYLKNVTMIGTYAVKF